MLGFIEGKIIAKDEKFFVIEAGGIGYKVFSHQEILDKIPEIGRSVKVWTHLYVREDALDLYGFLEREELDFFETLIGISGIGPKSALGILAQAPVNLLKEAIVSDDETFFTRVSGIGRKTAQKLVLELKSRLSREVKPVPGSNSEILAQALEALVSLGYKEREAREILRKLPKEARSVEEKVKSALKYFSKR